MDFVVEQGSGNSLAEATGAFGAASSVLVATYSLGDLTEALRDCPPRCKVELFTNLPNRWGRYFGSDSRRRARKEIQRYMQLLEPQRFQADVEVYFATRNHAKVVIVDDQVAYLGSANFANATSPSMEAGVLLYEPARIEELREALRSALLSDSRTYPFLPGSSDRLELLADLMDLNNQFQSTLERLHDQLHELVFPGFGEVRSVFRPAPDVDRSFFVEDLDALHGAADELTTTWAAQIGTWFAGSQVQYAEAFDDLVRVLEDVLLLPDPMGQLVEHDYQREVDDLYSERYCMEEDGGHGAELAQQEVEALFQDLAAEAEGKYPGWRAKVRSDWEDAYERCLDALKALADADGVDNT